MLFLPSCLLLEMCMRKKNWLHAQIILPQEDMARSVFFCRTGWVTFNFFGDPPGTLLINYRRPPFFYWNSPQNLQFSKSEQDGHRGAPKKNIPQGHLPCWYGMGLIFLIALKLLANVIGMAAEAAADYPL